MGFNDLWPTKLYLNKIDEDINKQLCDAIFLEIGRVFVVSRSCQEGFLQP